MKRTEDPAVIEHRLLELAYTTDTPISAATLAYFAPCSLEDAERVLDNLTTKDRIRMEVNDDGSITYELPNRHKLNPHRPFVPPPLDPPPVSLAPTMASPLALRHGRQASPLLAAVLSLLVPGAGQLYTGNVVTAVLWFILVGAGYILILPGLFLHMICIATAASAAHRLNSSLYRLQLPAPRYGVRPI
jgi:TM2 domain-containing membrane protein YozV